MKTKISVLVAAVAILTLSFTFVNEQTSPADENKVSRNSAASTPVGGFLADDVVK